MIWQGSGIWSSYCAKFLARFFAAILAAVIAQQTALGEPVSPALVVTPEFVAVMQSTRYDEAEALLKRMISEKPGKELWHCLGTVYYRKKEMAKAEQAFRSALVFDRNYWYPWGGLARVLFDQGRYEGSQQAQAKANALKVKWGSSDMILVRPSGTANEQPTLISASTLLERSADPACAHNAPQSAMVPRAFPCISIKDLPAGDSIGRQNHFAVGGLDRAVRTAASKALPAGHSVSDQGGTGADAGYKCERRAESFSDSKTFPGKGKCSDWTRACSLYNDGIEFLSSGRYEESSTKFAGAIDIYPYDPDFFLNLGMAFKRLRRFSEAETAYRKALALDQSEWDTWCNLGSVLYDQKRYEEARDAIKCAASLGPTSYGREHIKWFMEAIAIKLSSSYSNPEHNVCLSPKPSSCRDSGF
jgi:tetratricopeptide (TPR) repeat protein